MQIKMVVTDLDGTLLREDKTISERSLSALKKCREKGIKTVYATGRGVSTTTLVPHEFFDGYVRANGATAQVDDVLIYEKILSIENARELLIAADKAGIKIVTEKGGWHYGNFDVTEKWLWIPHSKIVEFDKLDIDIEKVYAVIRTPDDVRLIEKHMPDDAYLYVSRDDFAMVMHKEAEKSKAVAAVAAHWGIKQNEIVAFGDDTNDTELLKYCGTGVAMGNALDEVKAVANQICDTNESDGIAKWLEENVLS